MSNNSELAKAETPISVKFVNKVARQFEAELGTPLAWTPLQRTLAQHLYVKIDQSLRLAEQRRFKQSDPPVTWENVNQQKLAMDAVHRLNLELDALIPNHLHVIPYLNSKTGKYDLDLRPGYMGELHCHTKFGVDSPIDVRIELVHKTDDFDYGTEVGIAYVKHHRNNPFDPGDVIGGFGYIAYEDPRKNRVVIVEYREFEKAMKASKAVEFWGGVQTKWEKGPDGKNVKVEGEFDEKFRKEMMFKTCVLRVANKIPLDPAKVNITSWNEIIAAQLDTAQHEVQSEIAQHANKGLITMPAPSQLGGAIGTHIVTDRGITTTGPSAYKEDEEEPRGAHNADAGDPDQTPQPEPQDPATGAAEPEAAEEAQEQAKPAAAPKKRLILSKEQTDEMTARLAKIPDAATPPMFKAACERDGLDWAGVQARLSEIEAGEAARQPF